MMASKGTAEDVSAAHFDRIAAMLTRLPGAGEAGNLPLFGAVDVGNSGYWWDYGQVRPFIDRTCGNA